MNQQPIAVAIVNYNTCALLRTCLASVAAERCAEVVVVDNASTDGSAGMVAAEFPAVRLQANTDNPGFAAAVNQAVNACAAPFVLVLNSDTELRPGALAALARYLGEQQRAGVVGPRLVNPDGTLQPSCFHFPTPLHLFLELSNLSGALRLVPLVRRWYLRSWSHGHPRPVPWVLGAALAIRRIAFTQVGGFDESFFMYSEEVDFCYRLRQRGWETHFAPQATVMHIGGASTVQQRAAMTSRLFQSTLGFYRRHYGRGQLARAKLLLSVGVGAKLMRDAIRLRWATGQAGRERLAEDVAIWRKVLIDVRQS